MTFDIIHGDCLEVMAGMEAGSVDAVVCDPPYGLEFMGKEWDKLRADVPGRDDLRGSTEGKRESGGDFGKRIGITYGTPKKNPRCRICYRLKFDHEKSRCRCDNPDWDTRGSEYAYAMQWWHERWAAEARRVLAPSHYLLAFGGTRTWHRLACALEDAGFEIRDTLMWLYGSGFPKGKSCLKPAWEPVILARKPGPMLALGIDECRIGYATVNGGNLADNPHLRRSIKQTGSAFGVNQEAAVDPAGRWPANLLLDEEAAAMLDEQTGTLVSSKRKPEWSKDTPAGLYTPRRAEYRDDNTYGDSGGASRFFYCAKASRAERNAGLEGMEERTPWTSFDGQYAEGRNPATGERTGQYKREQSNHHPTVKPLSLMRYLCRLVTPPGGTVLDPFTGSGSTGCAAVLEGFDFIGIEREAEYVEIARRRIEAAAAQERLPV